MNVDVHNFNSAFCAISEHVQIIEVREHTVL